MVKSYQGEGRKKIKQVEVQPFLVSDYMATNLISFHPEQLIDEVMTLLLDHKISGGPVLNEAGELVGVISEGDCLKDVVKGKYHNLPMLTGKVKDYMARDVVQIAPDCDVFEAAHKFLTLRYRRFPVIKDGKVVGQVSQRDIIRAVKNMKSTTWY